MIFYFLIGLNVATLFTIAILSNFKMKNFLKLGKIYVSRFDKNQQEKISRTKIMQKKVKFSAKKRFFSEKKSKVIFREEKK